MSVEVTGSVFDRLMCLCLTEQVHDVKPGLKGLTVSSVDLGVVSCGAEGRLRRAPEGGLW